MIMNQTKHNHCHIFVHRNTNNNIFKGHIPKCIYLFICLTFVLGIGSAYSAHTHIWSDHGFKTFSKGETENLSLSSDGSLSLAPKVTEINGEKSDTAIISLISATDGTVYGGTSFQGRILKKEHNSKSFALLCETGELMVTSLCVKGKYLYAGTAPQGLLLKIKRKTGEIVDKFHCESNYIWSVIHDSKKRNLLLGTGPEGKIFEFTGKQFNLIYDSTARHILTLKQHNAGFVVGGTSDKAMVLNLGLDCKGPVRALFQPPQPECRSICIDQHSGTIYLCATTPPGGQKKKLLSSASKNVKLLWDKQSGKKKKKRDKGDKDKDGDKDEDDDGDDDDDKDKTRLTPNLDQASPNTLNGNVEAIKDHHINTENDHTKVDADNTKQSPHNENKTDTFGGKKIQGDNVTSKQEDEIRRFLTRVNDRISKKVENLKTASADTKIAKVNDSVVKGITKAQTKSSGSVADPKVPFSDGYGKAKQAVYAIDVNGTVKTIFKSQDDVLFSMVLFKNKLYCGSGNKGFIYVIDIEKTTSTRLLKIDAEQVTALTTNNDTIVAGSSNDGSLYIVSADLSPTGSYISDVKKLPFSARFGTVTWYLKRGASKNITIETRSGFTEKPDETWAEWNHAKPVANLNRSLASSPSARYFQYKLILDSQNGSKSDGDPQIIDKIEVCYQPSNLAPRILAIAVNRPPVTFRSNRNELSAAARQEDFLKRKKGMTPYMRTVQWKLVDANNDGLLSNLFLQLDGETTWDKLLDEPVEGNGIIWETISIPDGIYRLKLIVDDSISNIPDDVKSCERITEPFTIDNTSPEFVYINAVVVNDILTVTGKGHDKLSRIINSEYSLNGEYFLPATPADKIFDHSSEKIKFEIKLKDDVVAKSIAMKLFDEFGNHCVQRIFIRNGKGSYKK